MPPSGGALIAGRRIGDGLLQALKLPRHRWGHRYTRQRFDAIIKAANSTVRHERSIGNRGITFVRRGTSPIRTMPALAGAERGKVAECLSNPRAWSSGLRHQLSIRESHPFGVRR